MSEVAAGQHALETLPADLHDMATAICDARILLERGAIEMTAELFPQMDGATQRLAAEIRRLRQRMERTRGRHSAQSALTILGRRGIEEWPAFDLVRRAADNGRAELFTEAGAVAVTFWRDGDEVWYTISVPAGEPGNGS